MSLKLSQVSLISEIKRHTLNARVNSLLDNQELKRLSNNQILLNSKQVKIVAYDHINDLDGKVIYINNPRSGAGKTTLSLLLSKALRALNFKVCCIDIDPQSKLTELLLGKTEGVLTLYDFITKPLELSEIIINIDDNIDLIPSNIIAHMTEKVLTIGGINLIRSYINNYCLAPLREKYDVIIIDTPPNISLLSSVFSSELNESDQILFPIDLETFSLNETIDTITNVYSFNKLSKYIKPTHTSFIINKFIDTQADRLKDLLQKEDSIADCFSGIVINRSNEITKVTESTRQFSEIKLKDKLFENVRSLLSLIEAVK
jgi:chromosome partitioning protein